MEIRIPLNNDFFVTVESVDKNTIKIICWDAHHEIVPLPFPHSLFNFTRIYVVHRPNCIERFFGITWEDKVYKKVRIFQNANLAGIPSKNDAEQVVRMLSTQEGRLILEAKQRGASKEKLKALKGLYKCDME
jgi:hypothetical protein